MKIVECKFLEAHLKSSLNLPHVGKLKTTLLGLTYLSVDNNYVHRVFALINDKELTKPDYFQPSGVGAHISVIYPEEKIKIPSSELNQDYLFEIIGLFSATLADKFYYVLKVDAPTLVSLRKRYGLSEKLRIKNHLVDMHITVGVKYLESAIESSNN